MSISSRGSIRDAMQAIDRGALGTALLEEITTKEFIGLVTDGDIRRALLSGYGLESPVLDIPRPQSKTAHVSMSAEEITALFSDPVRVLPILDDEGCVCDIAIFDKRVRLPVAEPQLGTKELAYVMECVLTGWVSSAGQFVSKFEEMLAKSCNSQYGIATSSGTTALHLALLALGIGPGEEVIVPSLTFIATANAVTYTGAKPIFVDSEPTTWNLDPILVEKAITARTKAIIPVHLYGHPADMEPILEIAHRHNLRLVEDAAEAQGATYKGLPVGGLGDIGTFSFFGNKTITTGEGGMIVTNDSDLANKMRILRDHGMSPDKRYWHPVLGYNYRMTNIQAALGVAQMEKIETIIAAKRRIASYYTTHLGDIPGLQLPREATWAKNVYWLYSILVDESKFGLSRDELMDHLKQQGIDTRPLFPPVHTQPIYQSNRSLPVAEFLSENGLSLPSSVNLTESDLDRTITAIKKAQKQILDT